MPPPPLPPRYQSYTALDAEGLGGPGVLQSVAATTHLRRPLVCQVIHCCYSWFPNPAIRSRSYYPNRGANTQIPSHQSIKANKYFQHVPFCRTLEGKAKLWSDSRGAFKGRKDFRMETIRSDVIQQTMTILLCRWIPIITHLFTEINLTGNKFMR